MPLSLYLGGCGRKKESMHPRPICGTEALSGQTKKMCVCEGTLQIKGRGRMKTSPGLFLTSSFQKGTVGLVCVGRHCVGGGGQVFKDTGEG